MSDQLLDDRTDHQRISGHRGPRLGHHAAWLAAIALAATSILALQPPPASAASDPAGTDVVFLFDTSGSMSGELNEAKERIFEVMQSVRGSLPNVAFGVANVEDIPGYDGGFLSDTLSEGEYEADPEKPWRLDLPVTTDESSVAAAIDELAIYGGGDGPEAYSRALWETDTNPTVGWRPGTRHEIVLVADNVPHDQNLNEGLPETEWATNEETGFVENPFDTFGEPAGRWGIPGSGWTPSVDLGIRAVSSALGADGKPLQSVEFFGAQDGYLPYWEYWAGLSGGQAFDGESGELAPKLIAAIDEGAARPLSPCPSGLGRNSEGVCALTVSPPDNPTLSPTVVVAQGGGSGVAGGPLPAPQKPALSKGAKAALIAEDGLIMSLESADCGGLLVADAGSVGLTAAASFVVCGFDADSVASLGLSIADPPVAHYRSVLAPPKLPIPVTHPSCLHLSKPVCAVGTAASAKYVSAAARFAAISEALAVAIGRHSAAVAAGDKAAAKKQEAAASGYVSDLSKALAARRDAGHALGSWLEFNHLNRTVTAAQVLRSRKQMIRLKGFPARDISELKQLGLITSRRDLAQMLSASIARAGSPPPSSTLAEILAG